MLYTGLERAIQSGIASYKTFAVGGSGVGTIPVPKNKFIIIIDFDWFSFTDAADLSPEELMTRIVYQVEFRSSKSQNHFIIRNSGSIIGGATFQHLFQSFHKDVYLVHTENVQIDIVNVPAPDTWALNYSPLPNKSQETPTPTGYGVGAEPAVRKITFSGTEDYLPLTRKRDDLAATNYREQFRVDVNPANKLNPPLADATIGNFTYPVMNVSYVEFDVPWNEFVKSSN